MYGKRFDINKNYKHINNFRARRYVKGAILNHSDNFTSGTKLEIKEKPLDTPQVIAANGLKVWFTLDVESSSKKHQILNNFAIAVIEKLQVRFGDTEIQCIDHFNIFALYSQKWFTATQRESMLDQGVDDKDQGIINKLRLGLTGGSDEQQLMSKIYGNRFCFPISQFFEGLYHHPFNQTTGPFPLQISLTLAKNESVLKDEGTTGANGKKGDARFKIYDLDFEREILSDSSLRADVDQVTFNKIYYYDKITSKNFKDFEKTNNCFQLELKHPTRSLKALVLIFIDEEQTRKEYACENEVFYNPNFTRIDIQVIGDNHVLYNDGMRPSHLYESASSIFKFSDDTLMSRRKFFTDGFALVLNFKTIEDKEVHGSGKIMPGGFSDIHLTMNRTPANSSSGKVRCYPFVIDEAFVRLSSEGILVS